MTDNEIIKAFEHCCKGRDCRCCAYHGAFDCSRQVWLDVAAIIKRQRAEIEKLKIYSENLDISQKHLLNECAMARKTAKSEAIKEFAEQLKKRFYLLDGRCVVDIPQINNLVKEMTEGESDE